MTSDFDMTHIRKMILGVNVIVGQKALGGKVVDESTVFEVFVYLLRLFEVVRTTDVLLVLLGECSPLRLDKLVRMVHLSDYKGLMAVP